MNDDWAYEEVARELHAKTMVPGVWARAFADAGADSDKAQAIYIKYRVAQLVEVAELQKRDKQRQLVEAEMRRREAARQRLLLALRSWGRTLLLVVIIAAISFFVLLVIAMNIWVYRDN